MILNSFLEKFEIEVKDLIWDLPVTGRRQSEVVANFYHPTRRDRRVSMTAAIT